MIVAGGNLSTILLFLPRIHCPSFGFRPFMCYAYCDYSGPCRPWGRVTWADSPQEGKWKMKYDAIAPTVRLALIVCCALALAGCVNGTDQASAERLLRQQASQPELMFGATPLPMGGEDLGYFASIDTWDDGYVPFEFSSVYVRRTIHDRQSTRWPFTSGHRTRVFTVEEQFWLQP